MGNRDQTEAICEVMRRAAPLRAEIDRFEARWLAPPQDATPFPAVSWLQLSRQIEDLAATPESLEIAREALAGLRKLSPWMPAEMVLRRALVIAWAAMDEQLCEPAEAPEAG